MDKMMFNDVEFCDRFPAQNIDPRGFLFSCLDAGGTDGADDWGYALSGYADKYHPMGIMVYHSPMGHTRWVGLWGFCVRIDGEDVTQWGNLHVRRADADAVVLQSRFWNDETLGAEFAFRMVGPGVCRVSCAFENRAPTAKKISVFTRFYAISDVSEPGQVSRIWGKKIRTIPAGRRREAVFWLAAANTKEKAIRQAHAAQSRWDSGFEARRETAARLPVSVSSRVPATEQAFFHKVFNDLRLNLIDYGEDYFSAPNRVVHKGQWLWDTCFHAFLWDLFDPQRALDLLEGLFIYQREDGYVPISFGHPEGSRNHRSTQPPLIAFVLCALTDDSCRLARMYEPLERFCGWLEANRRLGSGLFQWRSAGESGMDNSPRFDDDPRRPAGTAELDLCGRALKQPIAHVDFSCQMALFYQAMERMAHRVGRPAAAADWAERDRIVRGCIQDRLYDPEDGFFYDRFETGAFQRIRTVSGFWPLLAGAATRESAERLVEALKDPSLFGTDLPVPSVAVNEPGFSLNYWRGPVWINTTFMTALGLIRYDHEQEARDLMARAYAGVKREWERSGHVWEHYDPFGGAAGRLEKKRFGPLENARHFVGWSGLVLFHNFFDEMSAFVSAFKDG